MRPITPPTLKLSVTSSFGPSVPVAVTGRVMASMLTAAMRTGTGASAGGGESARPRLQATTTSDSRRVRATRLMAWAPFSSLGESRLEPEVAQRGRALQVDVTHGVLVSRDDTVELGRGERGPGVHELDRAGDAFLVATADELEGAARRLQAIVCRRDRRPGDGGRVVRRVDFERDPLLEIPPERPTTVYLEVGSRAAGRVPAAVEQIPRDDERRDPVVLARAEGEVGALKAVVEGERKTRQERRGRSPHSRLRGPNAGVQLPQLLTVGECVSDAAIHVDRKRQVQRAVGDD